MKQSITKRVLALSAAGLMFSGAAMANDDDAWLDATMSQNEQVASNYLTEGRAILQTVESGRFEGETGKQAFLTAMDDAIDRMAAQASEMADMSDSELMGSLENSMRTAREQGNLVQVARLEALLTNTPEQIRESLASTRLNAEQMKRSMRATLATKFNGDVNEMLVAYSNELREKYALLIRPFPVSTIAFRAAGLWGGHLVWVIPTYPLLLAADIVSLPFIGIYDLFAWMAG